MAKRLTDAEKNIRDLTEREYQRAIVKVLRHCQFMVGHHYDSRFSDPGTKGQPDLLIVGHGLILHRELKRETGEVSIEQQAWGSAIGKAGGNWGVWKPSGWHEQVSFIEHVSGISVPPELRRMPRHRAPAKKRRSPSS